MQTQTLSKEDHLNAIDALEYETTPILEIDLTGIIKEICNDPWYSACFVDKGDKDLYLHGAPFFQHGNRQFFYYNKESNQIQPYIFGFDVWLENPTRLFLYNKEKQNLDHIDALDEIIKAKLARNPSVEHITVGKPVKQLVAEYVWWWFVEYFSGSNWTKQIYIMDGEKKGRVQKLPIWSSTRSISDGLYDETLFKKPLDLVKYVKTRQVARQEMVMKEFSSIPEFERFNIMQDFSIVSSLVDIVSAKLDKAKYKFRRTVFRKRNSFYRDLDMMIGCDQRAYQWHVDAIEKIEATEWELENGRQGN